MLSFGILAKNDQLFCPNPTTLIRHEKSQMIQHKYRLTCKQTHTQSYTSNGEREAPASVHRKYRCLGSQGCRPSLWPLSASGFAVMGRNPPVGSFPPTDVAQDVTLNASYRTSCRWHMQCDITTCIIFRWYKSGCAPFPGSPFASLCYGEH